MFYRVSLVSLHLCVLEGRGVFLFYARNGITTLLRKFLLFCVASGRVLPIVAMCYRRLLVSVCTRVGTNTPSLKELQDCVNRARPFLYESDFLELAWNIYWPRVFASRVAQRSVPCTLDLQIVNAPCIQVLVTCSRRGPFFLRNCSLAPTLANPPKHKTCFATAP